MTAYTTAQIICGISVVLNGAYGVLQQSPGKLGLAASSAAIMIALYAVKKRQHG